MAHAAVSRPTAVVVLDAADPVIEAEVAGQRLRLRLSLEAGSAAVLNRHAAARLEASGVRFGTVRTLLLGRLRIAGRAGKAPLTFAGGQARIEVESYARDCCTGVDGEIGAGRLPVAAIRLRRTDAPAPDTTRTFLIAAGDDALVLRDRRPTGMLFIRFAPAAPSTFAMAAAAAILSAEFGGRYEGGSFDAVRAFGVPRPARTIRFARVPAPAGFPLPAVTAFVNDFRGGFALPEDRRLDDELVVNAHRPDPQFAWPVLTLGADLLGGCAEIEYRTLTRVLTLHCAGQ